MRCERHGPRNRTQKRRDRFRYLLAGLISYGGAVTVTDITGPGVDVLPWDAGRCRHGRSVTCSGTRGCKAEHAAAAAWNSTAADRYRRLHDYVYAALTRKGVRPVLLAGTWEMQTRGVMHRHLVLGAGNARDAWAARAYIRLLEVHGPRFGFGYVERRPAIRGAKAAAQYLAHVAHYASKDETDRGLEHFGYHRQPVWMHKQCRERSATTMSVLADRRRAWAWRRDLCELGERLVLIDGRVHQADSGRCVEPREGPLYEALAV